MSNNIKKQFTLSVANVREGEYTNYPNVRKVSSIQELAECLRFDHVAGIFRNNYRAEENLISVNCFIMDMDNDSDNPAEWKTPEYIREKLHGVEFSICYSRNHMKQKKNKSPRPRFHIYLPFTRELSDPREICRYKEKILSVIPELDVCAKDAVRLIFGVENPEILHFDGDKDILEFLDAIPDTELNLFEQPKKQTRPKNQTVQQAPTDTQSQKPATDGDIILEGGRNADLFARGIDIIASYANVEDAKKAFWQECLKCSPRLDNEECATIWQHILGSDAKILADMAREIGDKDKFISEAKSKNFKTARILTVAKIVFENAPANEQITVEAVNDTPEMSNMEMLITLATENLINNAKLSLAHEKFSLSTDGIFDVEDIESAWNEALKSTPVKLSFLARQMKDNQSAYRSLAKGVTDDSKLICDIWNKVNEKKSSGGFRKIEKSPVNVNDVKNALKQLGITLKFDVITQKTVVEGLPDNNPYVLEEMSKLPEDTKKNVALLALPGIILPYLKDNNFSTNSGEVEAYLNTIAAANPFNPVREFFEEKEHDGKDRIKELLQIMSIEENSFSATLVYKWLIQACAMACNNGKFSVEFLLILKGKQGIGKTEFFRNIAVKPEWFTSGKDINTDKKDTLIEALCCWIFEAGELDGILKHEQALLKAFFTDTHCYYRMPYAKAAVKRERHTNFGGSVNDPKFIKDQTGSRRYGVIDATEIDSEKMRSLPYEWYQQLWRQVYDIFLQNNTAYRLTKEERALLESRNRTATESLPCEQEIIDIMNWNAPIETWQFLSPTQIQIQMKMNYLTAAKIGKVLTKLANHDNRIKIKRLSKCVFYLVPPIHLAGVNLSAYADTGENVEADNPPDTRPTSQQLTISPVPPEPKVTEKFYDTQEPAANIPDIWNLDKDNNDTEQPENTAELDNIFQEWNEHNPHNVVTENVIGIVKNFNSQEITFKTLCKKVTMYEARILEFVFNRLGLAEYAKIAVTVEDAKRRQIH